MKKNNHKLIIIALLIFALSLIFIYGGQFLFSHDDKLQKSEETVSLSTPTPKIPAQPVNYRHITAAIHGYQQEIFLLEFDPSDPRIEFKPVLSYNSIFGFEKLSDICKRSGAYAAVNAGFFFEYGDPSGMVAIDGKLKIASTGYAPVFVLENKKASFRNIWPKLSFTCNGSKIDIDEINRMGKDDSIILYTEDFGSTNRAKVANTSIRIENNIVTAVIKNSQQVNIKSRSHLISFYGDKAVVPEKLGIKIGDKLELNILPKISGNYEAYECGSLLVKDGLNVAPERDRWVGTLNNHDPRTAIGIKKDGKVVLLVVDGRQPGYSTGFTGKELADYLISQGIIDAALLDGGATSQMYLDGSIVNKPSDRGIARPVGGALVVKVNDSGQ